MANITPRERVWQSIRHQQPDRIPWHFGCTIPTRIKLEEYYGTTNLDEALDQHIVKFRVRLPNREIRPGVFQDEFGVVWNRTIDKDIGAVEVYPIQERSMRNVVFPDPYNAGRLEALSAFIQANPTRFRLVSIGFCLFERAWSMYGMAKLLEDMICEPEFVDELFEGIFQYQMAVLKQVLKYDIDAIWFGDDWGQQTGLIFGPRRWRRFIKPRIAQLYQATHEAGKAVMIHSCGKVQELFPELIELGLDVFNPFQPEVMDPYEMKQQFGNELAFYGGVSIQRLLPFGTPAQIRVEVHRLIDQVGQGGGYIISPSHEMPGDIPIENLVAFIDAVRE